MAGLAELFNAPVAIEYKDQTYLLRQPTVLEALAYQRKLEEDARANAARSVELSEEDRRNLLRDVNKDITAKLYAWGQEVCVLSLRTVPGIARLLSIICADQGLTEDMALELCEHKLRECVGALGVELEDDPKAQRLLCQALGLRADFLTSKTLSSGSGTRPSTDPSPNSETSASSSSNAGS